MGNSLKIFLFLAFLSILLLLTSETGPIRFLRNFADLGVNPIKLRIWQAKQFLVKKVEAWKRIDKMEKLQNDLEKLELEKITLKLKLEEKEKENRAMRKLLGAPLPMEWQFLPAKVLGLSRFLLLDKGRRDGVKKGMIVVFENILIGRVIELGERSSQVILPTDPDSKIAVETLGARGLVIGQFGKKLILDKVLQEEKLEKEAAVLTTGEEGVYPKGLIIGKIEKIEKQEEEPFQKAEIKPAIDYNKLENVFLITNF